MSQPSADDHRRATCRMMYRTMATAPIATKYKWTPVPVSPYSCVRAGNVNIGRISVPPIQTESAEK